MLLYKNVFYNFMYDAYYVLSMIMPIFIMIVIVLSHICLFVHHLFAVFSLLYYCLGWGQVFTILVIIFIPFVMIVFTQNIMCSLFVIPAKYGVHLLHVLCVIYFVNK